MRTISVLSLIVLLLIAVIGFGTGLLASVSAMRVFDPVPVSALDALLAGSVPFGIGTVALGSLAVVAAVLSTSPDQSE